MANVNFITFKLTDYKGKSESVRIFTPATATIAEMQSLANTLAAELDPITDAVIESASVSTALSLPGGLKASAVAGSDIERGINWGCDAANTPYRHTIRTPAPPDDIVAGEEIAPNADTNDWQIVVLAGDGVTAPSNQHADDLTAVLSARVTFHK